MSDYFVEGKDVLENKLGITDQDQLHAAELNIVYARMVELFFMPVEGEFNFNMLREIHRRLFSDIYQMAGQIRTVRIAKGNSVFCYPENIESEQQRIFGQLKEEKWLKGLEIEDFINRFAYYSSEINALHPFREGNGRAIKLFFKLLAESAGWDVDYSSMKPEELLDAEIHAFEGDLNPFIKILRKHTEKINME